MKITIIGAGNRGGAIAGGLAKETIFAETEADYSSNSTNIGLCYDGCQKLESFWGLRTGVV